MSDSGKSRNFLSNSLSLPVPAYREAKLSSDLVIVIERERLTN